MTQTYSIKLTNYLFQYLVNNHKIGITQSLDWCKMDNHYEKTVGAILEKEYDFTVTDISDVPGAGNDIYLIIRKKSCHIVLYIDKDAETVRTFTRAPKYDKSFHLSDPNVFDQINQLFILIFGQ